MKLTTTHKILALLAIIAASTVARASLPVEYAIWQEISSPDPSLRCWRMDRQIWCANAH